MLKTISLAVVLAMLLASASVVAKEPKAVDFLALAALMIKDGEYFRAADALSEIDENDEKLDKKRYYTLYGLVALNNQSYEEAIDYIHQAIDNGQTDEIMQVYLAQSHYNLQNFPKVIEHLDNAGLAMASNVNLHLMRIQSYLELDDEEGAWKAMTVGRQVFPENTDIIRRQVYLLIELGLYREAARIGLDFLSQSESVSADDYIGIGNALTQSGQAKEALPILEAARLRFPDYEKSAIALAHAYVAQEDFYVAADLLEKAAFTDLELITEAAELQRRADNLARALYLNAQALDQVKKLRQRLGLFLENGRFESAAMMEDALYRNRLLDDQNVRYALAYAFFKTGRFEEAEKHIAKLTKSDLFRKATALRKAMEDCEGERWRCL